MKKLAFIISAVLVASACGGTDGEIPVIETRSELSDEELENVREYSHEHVRDKREYTAESLPDSCVLGEVICVENTVYGCNPSDEDTLWQVRTFGCDVLDEDGSSTRNDELVHTADWSWLDRPPCDWDPELPDPDDPYGSDGSSSGTSQPPSDSSGGGDSGGTSGTGSSGSSGSSGSGGNHGGTSQPGSGGY